MAVLAVNWQRAVTLGAICIVLLLYVFTGELDSRTVARFSVDHKLWEQPKPKGPKMTEEQEEAAGLGHHVHTVHRDGGVEVVNKIGFADAREHQVQMAKPKKEQYKYPHKLPEARLPSMPPPERLLSKNKRATSQSRGNLGPPSVITDGKNEDWIKDRWQAAKDMSGTSLPLPQWVAVDLGEQCQVTRMMVDWETAFAKTYTIELSKDGKAPWTKVFHTEQGNNKHTADKHVTHDVRLGGADATGWNPNAKQEKMELDPKKQGRHVRLTVLKNGMPYGASIWEWQIFGFPVPKAGADLAAKEGKAAQPNATKS